MARKYDHEYKVQAVKLAKEIGGAKAAKELGIPEGTIHTWLKAVRAGKLDVGEGSHTCLLYTSFLYCLSCSSVSWHIILHQIIFPENLHEFSVPIFRFESLLPLGLQQSSYLLILMGCHRAFAVMSKTKVNFQTIFF